MQQKAHTHRSLEKALEILLSFVPHNMEMGTVDLSERVGFQRSTVNRILHVLERYGFVNQNPENKKFVLGHSVVDLGAAVQQSLNSSLIRIATPTIHSLRTQLRETVVLEQASPTCTIMVYIADGPGPIGLKEAVGAQHGYNAAAGAKSILAYSPEKVQNRILKEKLTRFTPNTIADPKLLLRHLKAIRRRGFSFDDEERNLEIRAFGCPVFSYEGIPVAAVVVAGPIHRITWKRRNEIVQPLKAAAAKISEQLYCSKPGA
jgi:IclR family transcriptional regulator, KDG regulon repressor